jgi:hypothetical protein
LPFQLRDQFAASAPVAGPRSTAEVDRPIDAAPRGLENPPLDPLEAPPPRPDPDCITFIPGSYAILACSARVVRRLGSVVTQPAIEAKRHDKIQ